MSRYVPIVAFVDEDVLEKLAPTVGRLVGMLEQDPTVVAFLAESTASVEMVAWGVLFRSVADLDLDVVGPVVP